VLAERKSLPRSKGCGDVLLPDAVDELALLDVDPVAIEPTAHRLTGVRLVGERHERTWAWSVLDPMRPAAFGVRRSAIDTALVGVAVDAGVEVLTGHEATEPLVARGLVVGASLRRHDGRTVHRRARYTVVADGANSTFGRALGTVRERGWPYATAIRSYWPSTRHDETDLEIVVDVRDRGGAALPGLGWICPLGDGTVNVGIGVLSTATDAASINVSHLLDDLARSLATRWDLDPETPTGRMRVGRIPMGGSVQPTAGPTFLVVGDAAAQANPFLGTGIGRAHRSGRIAADVLHQALSSTDSVTSANAIQQYSALIGDGVDSHDHLGRLAARIAGRPALLARLRRASLASDAVGRVAGRIALGVPDERCSTATRAVRLGGRLATSLAPSA
jgi:flavin-dependent dehydrogenase